MANYLHLLLESERIQLIPVSLKYAGDLCKEFTDEITKYMWPSAPKMQEEINRHIAEQQIKMQAGAEIALVVVNKVDQEFLGYASLHQANSNTPELGIWLKKSAHGLNYGFEAMHLLKSWAEKSLAYDYLKYPVAKNNIASRKIAEKLGGIIGDEYIKTAESGKLLDEVEYRVAGMSQEFNPTINEDLVRQLIDTQFPQWRVLPIQPVKQSGWDNRTFHLGKDLLVRLPSSADYAGQVEKEQLWLPKLAPHLPLPIPTPIAMGKPCDKYPWRWSIYRYIPGASAAIAPISNLSMFASQLAQFLLALQRIDSTDGPIASRENFYRGGSIKVYDPETREAIRLLGSEIDADIATALWEHAINTTWQKPPVWIHGDVSRGNLLIQEGHLSAVIDFGQLAIGDPACDLAIAWTLFEGESREVFRQTLNLDADTWIRGQAWALWKALIIASGLTKSNNVEAKEAHRIIDAVLADYKQAFKNDTDEN